MGTKAEDRQLARNEDLCNSFFVLAALEIGAGMNGVLASPACRTEERIQPVSVSPLVSVRNHQPSYESISLGRVYDSPFNYRCIEWHFQLRHQFLDLLCRELSACGRPKHSSGRSRFARRINLAGGRSVGMAVCRSYDVAPGV